MTRILLLVAILPIAACSGDPSAYGITGPAGQITPPAAAEPGSGGVDPAAGGLVVDPSRPGGSTSGRYWRYN